MKIRQQFFLVRGKSFFFRESVKFRFRTLCMPFASACRTTTTAAQATIVAAAAEAQATTTAEAPVILPTMAAAAVRTPIITLPITAARITRRQPTMAAATTTIIRRQRPPIIITRRQLIVVVRTTITISTIQRQPTTTILAQSTMIAQIKFAALPLTTMVSIRTPATAEAAFAGSTRCRHRRVGLLHQRFLVTSHTPSSQHSRSRQQTGPGQRKAMLSKCLTAALCSAPHVLAEFTFAG